jgi:hypothetical protein
MTAVYLALSLFLLIRQVPDYNLVYCNMLAYNSCVCNCVHLVDLIVHASTSLT